MESDSWITIFLCVKTCTKCSVAKSESMFGPDRRNRNGLKATCRACDRTYHAANATKINARTRGYRKANRDHYRDMELRREYGLTLDEFNQRLASQGGVCAICKTDKPGGNGNFHVDHDHVTGKIRGLLCTGCNIGIGNLKDDPAILLEAAAYLRGTADQVQDALKGIPPKFDEQATG